MALTGDEYTRNLLLNEIAQKLGLPTMSNLTGDPYTRNLLLEQIKDAVGNAPVYLPKDGDAPTGTTDGDRWIKDNIEYYWDSSLGASGVWVQVNSQVIVTQAISLSAQTNLIVTATPGYFGRSILFNNLRFSGTGGATHDATNFFTITPRYWLTGSSALTDVGISVDTQGFDVSSAQNTVVNMTPALLTTADDIAVISIRATVTGSPPTVGSAAASLTLQNVIIP